MRIIICLAAAACALPAAIAGAQSVGKMLENDFRNFGTDIWAVWSSPFRAGPRDWLTAAAVVGASAAAAPLDDNVDRAMVRNRNWHGWSALKEVREGGVAFSGKTITPIAIGTLIASIAFKNESVQDGLFGCLASYVSGSVVRNQVFYRLIARERPSPNRDVDSPPAKEGDQYELGFPGESDWGQHSLPAGHAANIISCASFLSHRFEMGPVEPALYAVATGVGVGRLVDRRHWTSDTMLGMAFGYAIGKEVARRSLDRKEDKRRTSATITMPTSGFFLTQGPRGTLVGWQRSF